MPRKSKKIKERSPKEERLFQNLLKITEQYVQGKNYQSASEVELRRRLGLPDMHTEMFRDVLKTLLEQEKIILVNGEYRCHKKQNNTVVGTIRMHPRGFGFVQADDPEKYPEDIFIPKPLTQNAVDGDTVEIQINLDSVSEKGPEGRVVAILSRGRTHIAGIIRHVEKYGDIIAYVPLLGSAKRVVVKKDKKQPLREGDRLLMKVIEWGEKDSDTICSLEQHLGHISDPSCDIIAAIKEFDIRSQFPASTIKESKKIGTRVTSKEIAGREDLRSLETFTIDPDTAKDFDDALSLTKDKKGHYFLGVHIADVSHYVQPGTTLNTEAQQRCNSTYFPGECVPMLPEALSNNLCSLKANVNRLTASVMVHFNPQGDMVDYRIARTVIKSAKRFTYREAKEVLDGKRKSRHLSTLNLMVELCKLLKRKRYERGSIEFCLPELVVKVNASGEPVGTDYVDYDVTHQLVEEFMLKANELVAWHLSEKGKHLTYRVHDVPAEENMRDFSILAGAFGFRISPNPTPAEMQKLFDEALTTPYGPYLATSYIRRMRLASYSTDNIGHYGLGLTHYCHFTSPIRRYVDLVVHRILFGDADDRLQLEKIAQRCSEQERISAKAENRVIVLKKLRLLDGNHKKDPYKQYEAVVTKVRNFGIFFEVLELMLEGFLHISEIGDDYFVYDDASMSLTGSRYQQRYTSGDRITVMLKNVDLILAESEWSMVPDKVASRIKQKQPRSFGKKMPERRSFPAVRNVGKSRPSKKNPPKKSQKPNPSKKKNKKVGSKKR